MIGGKILGKYYIKMRKHGGLIARSDHRYAAPSEADRARHRKGIAESPEQLTEQQKWTILYLAAHYEGEELEKRLEALQFCSAELAKELLI